MAYQEISKFLLESGISQQGLPCKRHGHFSRPGMSVQRYGTAVFQMGMCVGRVLDILVIFTVK
ncbi:MAG: hypothetical protein NC211_00205 [Alistipes senegalensis]|nr:hypothetical protein [Oxalobacter formigenes]MCM1280251.1 hypothetical protein [Alistipes senegalensis]